MNIISHPYKRIAFWAILATLSAGCSSDLENPVNSETTNGTVAGTDTGGTQTNSAETQPVPTYSISLSNDSITVIEGGAASVNILLNRTNGYNRAVNLAIDDQSPGTNNALSWTFNNTQLQTNQNSATATINLNFSQLPIQRETRTLRVLATDGSIQKALALNVNLEPTTLPDVYLLVGQSNMVGSSEDGAKQAFAGGLDAPNPRIRQLNVTGNDGENFDTAASFTNVNTIAVPGQRLTTAVDPLHDGFDSAINGKMGDKVGMGMSFAKRALPNTQATIYLVPAAWSNTGFCTRTRPAFEGELGWNATPNPNPAFSGTLLHDRAIARANLTLGETGGILRGILWHQGEADSDESTPVCAQQYQQNMSDMVKSFRNNIQQDPRGAVARGDNGNVPFVVGTMSKGGVYDFFWEEKAIVDNVHRSISSIIPYSAFVDNAEFVPPSYPCGEGDCIHFGSTSLREMGSRYYDFLIQATTSP